MHALLLQKYRGPWSDIKDLQLLRSGRFEMERGIWGLSHLHRHSWQPVFQTGPAVLSLAMGFRVGQEARRLLETSV